ncbi:hypothetical protein Patl1_33164 [Pistacia atlantica]|uniref:Uncharacterized protein n=1 Tax=Pistacia atlantica TaxID=434234 RepID=A0ACC1AMU6_9ROSI|nr:hypothetical protein Patl1_33164 [Pistacia atlantica]
MFLQCLGKCFFFCQKLAGVMLVLVEFAGKDAGSLLPSFCDSGTFSADFCCCSVVFAGSDAGACWRRSSRKMHFWPKNCRRNLQWESAAFYAVFPFLLMQQECCVFCSCFAENAVFCLLVVKFCLIDCCLQMDKFCFVNFILHSIRYTTQ